MYTKLIHIRIWAILKQLFGSSLPEWWSMRGTGGRSFLFWEQFRLAPWFVGRLVGWLASCLVGWSVFWLVGWLIGWFAGWVAGWLLYLLCLLRLLTSLWWFTWFACWPADVIRTCLAAALDSSNSHDNWLGSLVNELNSFIRLGTDRNTLISLFTCSLPFFVWLYLLS